MATNSLVIRADLPGFQNLIQKTIGRKAFFYIFASPKGIFVELWFLKKGWCGSSVGRAKD
jgi:hypothetical protein